MCMIIPPTYAVGVTLLFSILPQADQKAFNWDAFGGTPPESDEPIAYRTISTLQPTPKWAKRIKDFLKRNRPRHPVEMLFPDNFTALVEQHKHIKRNMTLDPSWAWRRFSELDKLKGTTVEQIPDHLINFTFPDMSIGTYDNSKTDEALNDYINKVTIETDYDKLKAKYDPYDIVNNKSIDWGKPTYDDEEFDQFLQKRIESEERKDHMYENGVEATIKFNKEDRAFAKKWGIPLEERRHNMSIYGTWIYRDNITVIPERTWIPIEDLNRTMFDKLAELNLDEPFGYTPLFMRK